MWSLRSVAIPSSLTGRDHNRAKGILERPPSTAESRNGAGGPGARLMSEVPLAERPKRPKPSEVRVRGSNRTPEMTWKTSPC